MSERTYAVAEQGVVPAEEMPTGDDTETLEMERRPVRITFPGDAANAARSPRSARPWSEPPAPGARDSSPGLRRPPLATMSLLGVAVMPPKRRGR
jgi:hypothetical protein